MSALMIWLPLALAALGLIAWRLRGARRISAVAFVCLVLALIAVDLFRANMGFNPAIRERNAVQPATGCEREQLHDLHGRVRDGRSRGVGLERRRL